MDSFKMKKIRAAMKKKWDKVSCYCDKCLYLQTETYIRKNIINH